MYLPPRQTELSWSEFVVVRLLRRWAATRVTAENPLPALVELAAEIGEPPATAVALHSLFQLTESCLARPLESECCCSRALSPDEQAVLVLLAGAPTHAPPVSSGEVPHGLPGALLWAAATVRTMLGSSRAVAGGRPARCPFERREIAASAT